MLKISIPLQYLCSAFDLKSLNQLTSKTKLIISVVGPYSLFGKQLIESCVNNQCHYLDLTGEPEFVHFVENNFAIRAKENGVIEYDEAAGVPV